MKYRPIFQIYSFLLDRLIWLSSWTFHFALKKNRESIIKAKGTQLSLYFHLLFSILCQVSSYGSLWQEFCAQHLPCCRFVFCIPVDCSHPIRAFHPKRGVSSPPRGCCVCISSCCLSRDWTWKGCCPWGGYFHPCWVLRCEFMVLCLQMYCVYSPYYQICLFYLPFLWIMTL